MILELVGRKKETATSTLAEFVGRMRLRSGLSREEFIAAAVARSNGEISGPYLNKIIDGRSENLSVQKIKALAKALDCDVATLSVVLGLTGEGIEPLCIEMSKLLQQIDTDDRELLVELLESLIKHATKLQAKRKKLKK